MHIHILGICGTFMGSLAQLALANGYRVTGSDANVYPPMSTQLEQAGIELFNGFDPSQLSLNPDLIVVGNVVSRGNPVMEAILNKGIAYISGPQWLAENILKNRWVLAVAGTHGKTTTSSMLAWILEYAGMSPGYLIGGVPGNFSVSARLGETDFFVIEADEYDTAFFDKRSKFVHYHPNTLLINNVEFDHADIFADLQAIQTQFHHLIRTVPSNGLVIHPQHQNVDAILNKGCWSERQRIGREGDWMWSVTNDSLAEFDVLFQTKKVGNVSWQLGGYHNIQNAIGAIAAARHVGVLPEVSCEALSHFAGVKRRMELLDTVGDVNVYDDFAHHPTAIASTIEGLRAKVGDELIWVIVELRSNTMKQGIHKDTLMGAVANADLAYWYCPAGIEEKHGSGHDQMWDPKACLSVTTSGALPDQLHGARLRSSSVYRSTDEIITTVVDQINGKRVHLIIMSNGGFDGIHPRLIQALKGGALT